MERNETNSLWAGGLETVMSPWGEGLDPSHPRDKEIIGTVVKYQEMLLGYTCAMKEVQTRREHEAALLPLAARRSNPPP